MRRHSARGFTLIELVVALTLFALISSLAYGGLVGLINAKGMIDDRSQRLRAVQMAVAQIERDLRHVIERPVRDGYGGELGSLAGGPVTLEFSSLGPPVPPGFENTRVRRLGYLLDQEQLLRLSFPVLDRAPSSVADRQPLLPGVQRLDLRYLDREGRWRERWPPQGQSGLPRALELRLELADLGEIRRLIELIPPPPP